VKQLMSAIRSKVDIDVALTSAFDLKRTSASGLFDHVIGAHQQRRRHVEAEQLGGLEIDDQLAPNVRKSNPREKL
jgi:hypothetical protein